MKYIKMASSFNFGEVVSIVIASILLPFLPETPIQLLVESLLYDLGQLTLPFDIIVFAAMWFIFSVRDVATFQTIWFSYSIVSNLVGMHIIRTAKIPFVQSNAHKMVYFSSILLSIVGIVVPYTILGNVIGLVPLELKYLSIIIIVPILYCFVALIAKKIYIKKYGEWI